MSSRRAPTRVASMRDAMYRGLAHAAPTGWRASAGRDAPATAPDGASAVHRNLRRRGPVACPTVPGDLAGPLPRQLLRRLRLGGAAGPVPRRSELGGRLGAIALRPAAAPAGRPLPARRLRRRRERLRRLPLVALAPASLVVRPPRERLPARQPTGRPSRPTAPGRSSGTRPPPPAPASSPGCSASGSAGGAPTSPSWSAGPTSSTPPASTRRPSGGAARGAGAAHHDACSRPPTTPPCPPRVIEAMQRRPLAEIAAEPWVEPARWRRCWSATSAPSRRCAAAARVSEGVVEVDLAETALETRPTSSSPTTSSRRPATRWWSRATAKRTKVSVGSNPWARAGADPRHLRASASGTAAAATRWWARSSLAPDRLDEARRVRRAEVAATLQPDPGGRRMTPGQYILVVDDDDDFREALSRGAGRRRATRCSRPENGEVALARVADEQPGIVLLDLKMPVLDGWGVMERMRGDPTQRRACPSSSSPPTASSGRRSCSGAQGYIPKSVGHGGDPRPRAQGGRPAAA